MALCYNFPVQTGLLLSAQTSMEVAGLSCPALILAWKELENNTRNNLGSAAAGFRRVLYFRAQFQFGCSALRAPLLLRQAGRGSFLFDYTEPGEICASCLMRKALPGRRNKQ